MFWNLFKGKPEKGEEQPVKAAKAKDRTPAFLGPLYPYRAVGDALDPSRLDDFGYIEQNWVLYELKCPNPECVLNARTQGANLKQLYLKIRDDSGCPACKLQFGANDAKGYEFKEGELVHEVPKNKGRWEGFTVRRVIFVPEDVFDSYGRRMYGKPKEDLNRTETDAICEEYYKSGDWKSVEAVKVAEAKAKKAEMDAKREEAIKNSQSNKES